jgi:hypothetical protein
MRKHKSREKLTCGMKWKNYIPMIVGIVIVFEAYDLGS